jgi:outer membrane protein TolC
VDAALEAYRIARIRYREDVAIQLEVITAQAQLTNARATLVNARYAYLSSYAELQKAIGEDKLEEFGSATKDGQGE